MKIKNLLAGLFLGITMAAGVAAGVSVQANAAKEVKAGDNVRFNVLVANGLSWLNDNARTFIKYSDSIGEVEMLKDSNTPTIKIGETTYHWYTIKNDFSSGYNDVGILRKNSTASTTWNEIWQTVWRDWDVNGLRNNVVEITDNSGTFGVNKWGKYSRVTLYSGLLDYTDTSSATINNVLANGWSTYNPEDPTVVPTGYTFTGWFTDKNLTDPYVASQPDGSDITLYAQYSEDICTITKYAVYNGTVDRDYPLGTDSVASGTSYPVPTPVYKQNYQFGGWYLDEACTSQPYTSPQAITDDTDLYAKYTWGKAWGGTLRFDLRNSGWAAGAAKYAVYFFDETTYTFTAKGWSELISAEVEQRLIEIPYNIAFAPDKVILVRFNTTVVKSTWEALDDYADARWDNKWNQTSDGIFDEMKSVSSVLKTDDYFWLKGDDYAELWGSKYGYDDDDYKIGWLANYKVNGSKHVEFYETLSLTEVTKFHIKIGNNETCANFTTHPSLSGIFSTVDGYIRCNAANTYSLYYDTVTTSVYITTEALAAADGWAELFLGVTAETDNCTFTKNNWTASETAFGEITNTEAINLIKNETHYGPHDATSTYLAKAIQRYDYVLQLYGIKSETNPDGFTDFLGRVAAGKISLSHPITIIGGFNNNNTTPIIVIVIVSLVAVTTIGGYFYLRKRKQD